MNNPSVSSLIPELSRGWGFSRSELEGEMLFSHQKSGDTFEVNQITQLILEKCDGLNNVSSIISDLEDYFQPDTKNIERDVKALLHDLVNKGVVRYKQPNLKTPAVKYSPRQISTKKYKLCVGMATFDDYDGVYFSIQAIRMYHPEVLDDIEFVVIDNNPSGVCADALKSLGDSIPNYRYVEGDNFQGTWSRFSLVQQSNAPYILCMDSHVMIMPGAIKQLIEYFSNNPETPNLLQGPLVYDDLVSLSSHFSPNWCGGMFGAWASDSRAEKITNEGFDIPMQGLGLFAFNKIHWPQINPRFKGFGGEEGYIHEKVRRAGGRTLCLPFLRWVHRFNRPMGAHYNLNWEDRIRNYMICHEELGIDNREMIEHFRSHIGQDQTDKIVVKIEQEINNPFYYFDAIFCINLDHQQERWAKIKAQFEKLGVAHRLQRLSAIETPENHHIGCALSHKKIIEISVANKYKNVLVVEDNVVFDSNINTFLSKSIAEVKEINWQLLYLGGYCADTVYPPVRGSEKLREVGKDQNGPTGTHAIVYNESVYSKILSELPSTLDNMKKYVETTFPSIDHFYAGEPTLIKLMVTPFVASQPNLLDQESPQFMPMSI